MAGKTNGGAGRPLSGQAGRDARRGAPGGRAPSWAGSVAPFGFTGLMCAAGAGCAKLGSGAAGAALAAIGVVPTAVASAVTARVLPAVLGPRRDAGQEELGPYLGGGGDRRVGEMSPGVSDQGHSVIEWNRAEEADRTWHWLQGLPVGFEDVEVTSDDGTRLAGHALACRPDSSRWLVFAHGFNDNWRAGLTYARRFAEAGFNLLLVDLRAHGASGGAWVGAGWLDRRDLVAWCRWVVGRAGEGARVALMGISMGAASALMACGEPDLPSQVRVCVADSAFTDFWSAAVGVVSTGSLGTPPVPAHPLIDLARLFLRAQRGGYDMALSRPVDAIARSRAPVILVHGEQDRVCPPQMGEALCAAAGGAAAGEGHELVTFPDAGHCCAVFADPGRYWDHVLGFVGARV